MIGCGSARRDIHSNVRVTKSSISKLKGKMISKGCERLQIASMLSGAYPCLGQFTRNPLCYLLVTDCSLRKLCHVECHVSEFPHINYEEIQSVKLRGTRISPHVISMNISPCTQGRLWVFQCPQVVVVVEGTERCEVKSTKSRFGFSVLFGFGIGTDKWMAVKYKERYSFQCTGYEITYL